MTMTAGTCCRFSPATAVVRERYDGGESHAGTSACKPGQPIDLGGHDEVVLVQALDLLRLQGHRRVAPTEADVRVMSLRLGKLADLLHECESLAEVPELEGSFDSAGHVRPLPPGTWACRSCASPSVRGGTPPLQGVQNFSVSVSTIRSSFAEPFPKAALCSVRRHALFPQFLQRLIVLREMRHTHPAQHMRRLGELDVVVADDLDAVPPRIEEIQEPPRERLDARRGECLAHRFLVIDHEAKMPAVICGLPAALLQREELVAKIDEGHVLALAAQLELEQPAIECQRLFDAADFERDVIETDRARFSCFGHGALLMWLDSMWGGWDLPAIAVVAAFELDQSANAEYIRAPWTGLRP